MHLVIEHADVKVDDREAVLHAVLLHCGSDIPLRQTVAILGESSRTDISHATLHCVQEAQERLHSRTSGWIKTHSMYEGIVRTGKKIQLLGRFFLYLTALFLCNYIGNPMSSGKGVFPGSAATACSLA
jgi:hypothetical protein